MLEGKAQRVPGVILAKRVHQVFLVLQEGMEVMEIQVLKDYLDLMALQDRQD